MVSLSNHGPILQISDTWMILRRAQDEWKDFPMFKQLLLVLVIIAGSAHAQICEHQKMLIVQDAKDIFLRKTPEEQVKAFQGFVLLCQELRDENEKLIEKLERVEEELSWIKSRLPQ
jgi:hypothetical protein